MFKIFSRFPRTFWIANTIELFERWAWYGLFNVLAIYLTASRDTGALGFSQEQKGTMMGVVSAILYFLPVITGSIADKLGYKKVLLISFGILSTGYLTMGYLTDYNLVFAAFFYIAVGGALFKPVISATIAKTTNKSNSSIGFGIFYMMVNIGAMIGPFVASKLREMSWMYVFYLSTGIVILNFILVLFFYKEPDRVASEEKLGKTIIQALKNIFLVLKDFKFLVFLILIIGFWSMYWQLFYSLPVFIDQWADTTALYKWLENISPWLAKIFGNGKGSVNPEMILNMDSLYIVCFQVLVSSIMMKMKPVNSIILGIIISAIGIGLTFAFNNPFFLFVSILVFGLGEMTCSPKITEYIGRIAPADKVGLYMGCSFLPVSGGNFFAGILSGSVYMRMSDKITLLREDLLSKGIDMPAVSESFTQNDLLFEVSREYGMSMTQLTDYLWNTYHPGNIWYLFTGIGLGTALLLFLFNRFVVGKR